MQQSALDNYIEKHLKYRQRQQNKKGIQEKASKEDPKENSEKKTSKELAEERRVSLRVKKAEQLKEVFLTQK